MRMITYIQVSILFWLASKDTPNSVDEVNQLHSTDDISALIDFGLIIIQDGDYILTEDVDYFVEKSLKYIAYGY